MRYFVSIFVAVADVKKISDSNFYEIIESLGSEELPKLYQALDLTLRDVERAEKKVPSSDIHLKARSVIRWWQKTKYQLKTFITR